MVIDRRVRAGFTLLEMMLVVVIMGILATVAVVSMSGNLNKAKRDKTVIRMRQIKVALDEYNGRYSVYPPSLAVLTAGSSKTLESSGLYDGWEKPFSYSFPGSSSDPNQPYDLYSAGGVAGGATNSAEVINVWTLDKR